MNDRNRRICRFCLKVLYNEFQMVEESTKQMFEMLLLKPNLDIRTGNMICNECAIKLQTTVEFKSACLNTEKKVLPFINSEENARAVLKEEVELKNVSEDQKICRFCKQLTEKGCYTYLQRENMFMVDMIQKHIPEMYIRVTNQLITCKICLDSLESFLNFIMDLTDVEEKIKNVDSLGAQIRLYDIPDQTVKHEINCRDIIREEFGMVKNKIENDNSMVLDNQEFNIKHEEIEIKSENDCDSFQHTSQGISKNIHEFDRYTSESYLTSHITIYKCKLCSYESKHKLYMDRHIRTHEYSSEIMYKHEMFLYNSKSNNRANPHLACEDPLAINIFRCELCAHETNRKANLKLHLLTHQIPSDLRMYKCEKCSYATDQKGSLKQHMIIHQTPSEIQAYKCDMCPFDSKHRNSLDRHLLTHLNTSEATIYKCQSCPFQSKHQSSLVRHILTHQSPSEKRMFKCIHCPYEAPQKDRLRRHMLTHQTSEVPMYKCEMCTFKTKRSDKLKRHMLTHQDISEVKLYNCEKCCYKTKRKDHIKQHMFTHQSRLENNIHKCDTCPYAAKYKRCLDKHVLTHYN